MLNVELSILRLTESHSRRSLINIFIYGIEEINIFKSLI